VVYFSFYLGDLVFRNYDPYSALMHLGNEFEEKIIAYLLLFIFLISALFSKSWWCRYFCPLGAFFAIFKKIGFLKIKREESSCINCSLCECVWNDWIYWAGSPAFCSKALGFPVVFGLSHLEGQLAEGFLGNLLGLLRREAALCTMVQDRDSVCGRELIPSLIV
jgi:hypothetical protein